MSTTHNTSNFTTVREVGKLLVDGGYIITPIKPKAKAPVLKNWSSQDVSRDFMTSLNKYPHHGVGVLCGVGEYPIVAIDSDTPDKEFVQRIREALKKRGWLKDDSPVRVGREPKFLVVLRASEAGWPKMTTPFYVKDGGEKCRVEILGAGQQFVSHGIHPTTGKPYQWYGCSIADVPAKELIEVTFEELKDFLAEVDRIATGLGYTIVSAGSTRPTKGTGGYRAQSELEEIVGNMPLDNFTLEKAKQYLERINADDYDQWLQVGMALHHQFGGDMEAFNLFDEWSAQSPKYTSTGDCLAKWHSFGHERAAGAMPVTARTIIKLANEARSAEKAEKAREAFSYACESVKLCDRAEDLMRIVSKAVIESTEYRDLFIKLVRRRYKEITGKAIKISDIVRRMPALLINNHPLTEFGNAARFAERYVDAVMYVRETEEWYVWKDSYWERVPDTVIRALVKETVDSLIDSLQNVDDESGEIRKFVKSSQSAKMISSMETLAKLDSRIAVSNKALNANPDLFALRNAVINLRTGEVLEPDPKTRITRYADYDYDPEAECPLWMEQLRQVFKNDMAVVDFFMRTLAYTLLGNPVESKILLPFGTGANGKSTVMNVVRALFGQYGCMAQAEVFMVRGGNNSASAPGEALLRMEGARFVYAMEPPEDGVLRESFIKAATGGEPIVARPMYGKHSIEYKPVFVIWMPTNYKPIVKGDNIATWRRLILIPFTACFEGEDKDPHRLEKLLKELPGILNLLIRKYIPQYLKNGLDIPPQIKAATEEYKDDMDLTGSFIAECCELDPTYYVSTQDLFNAWTQWSTSSGEFGYISSARKLGRVLAAKGFTQVKHLPGANSTRGFYGLRLRARDISEF